MQVPYQSKQVFVFIAKQCLVTPLKEMPHSCVFFIEIAGIGKVKKLHNARNGSLLRFNEKVNMVAHKDISIESEVALFLIMFHTIQILKSVLIIVKDVLFPVSSDYDMIESAGKLYARRSCHKKEYHIFNLYATSLTPRLI